MNLLDLLGSEWNEWRIVLMVPLGWPGRIVALAVAALTLFLAWRALRLDTRRRRRLLLVLRAGGVLSVLLLFFQPALKLRNVTRLPNHIAVLVDTSESMSLAEQGSGETRAARVAALLTREQPELLRWQGQHKIDFYTFGDRLQPATVESLTRPGGHPSHADATRIREALAAVRQRYEGRDLAGVVLFSDGLDNGRLSASDAALATPRSSEPARGAGRSDGKKDPAPDGKNDGKGDGKNDGKGEVFDADTRDFLRTLDAPVHTVAVGRPGLRDVAIARVLADQFAFARTAVEVEARLQVLNAEAAGWQGRSLPVTLRRDGVPVLTVDVELRPGQSEYRVVFPFTPERVGKYLYEISTPVLPGEAIAENNHRAFILKVVRDKIRVVHVAGRPTWDARFLRGLLKHDPNIDLVAFFILRSPSDLEPLQSEETSLIPFPCEELFQEQLRSFDLIILHNFNYTAYCGQYLQPAIVPFVNDGGAVAMIGGDLSFSSGGYYGSELAQILPVVLHPDDGSGLPTPGGPPLIDPEPFHPRLTPAGKSHVVTALRLDVKENGARWDALPPLEGLNLVARARPQATVLLAHPKHKDADGNPMPVLTVAEFGKGRTLALQADSTWRWGFGAVTPRAQASGPPAAAAGGDGEGDARGSGYQRFYEQAIRWLIRDPSLRLLRIETSDTEYRRDQQVRVEVRAFGPDYQPAQRVEITLSIARVGTPELSTSVPAPPGASHTVRTDEDGAASSEWPPLPPGGYRVTARALLGGRPAEDTEVFVVRGAARELENPEADDRLLQQLSTATSGIARGYADRAGLSGLHFQPPHIVHVNQHRDIELWNNWAVLLLGVLCFSLNWFLRRRWGYA